MPVAYGYIRGTVGADGSQTDCFIGHHLKSPHVFVIDQHNLGGGGFDEHKCFIGFGSEKQAREAYKRAFSDGKGSARIGHIATMTVEKFKEWLRSGGSRSPVKARAAGGRVGYAGGGAPAFEETSAAPAFDETAPVEHEASEPADHGLSGRQKLSPVQKAINPLTSYWDTYKTMNKEGRDQMSRGMSQIGNGPWETTKGIANVGLGGLSYLTSPINAGYRTVAGQPIEDVTGIPREYTEFAGQLATPGLGLAKMPKAPGAVAEAAPRMVPQGPEAVRAGELGDEFGINYSRGQRESDLDRIRYEDTAARGAYGKEVQDRAAPFFDKQHADVQSANREVVQPQLAGSTPVASTEADAAGTLSSQIADRAQQAQTIVNRVLGRAADETNAQRGMVADQGRTLDDAVRGPAQPIANPREMGEVVGQNVRDAAAENRADFRAKYDEFGRLPGEFRSDAVVGLGNRVKNDLTFRDQPVIIDDQLTPVASRAIRDLDEMSAPRIQNRADPRSPPSPGEVAAVSLKGVDQMRKKLVAYYQAARASGPNGAADARAMQAVMDGFDTQIERAITEGLFSGDPRALQALQEARASYANYRRTYTPQGAGDDVGTAMRRIVERNATPEETANMIVGSGKIGSAGTPVRLADRLEQVLGAGSDGWSAIRQAMWQKASQVRNAAGEIDPAKSAAGIVSFTDSTLARRMFSPEELRAMRSHARGVQDLERAIAQSPATRDAEAAQGMYNAAFGGEGIGGQQQAVFRRLVEGTATPQEISGVVFNAIGGGNPGNVSRMIGSIERIVGRDSDAMSAIRQGVWQRSTVDPTGRIGAQRVVNNINQLLHGKGEAVARALYTPEQRALMERYAEAVQRTIIPKYARTNSDSAIAAAHIVRKYASMVTSAFGAVFHGGITGGLEGYGVGKLIDKGVEKYAARAENKNISDSLNNFMPKDRARLAPNVSGMARAAPLSGPGRAPQIPYRGTNLGSLQGPVPAYSDTEEHKP